MVSDPLTDRLLASSRQRYSIDSPMRIVCPSCQTSYQVSAASLGAEGRQVRCVRCKDVWHATPVEDDADQPAPEPAGMSAAAASAQYRRGAGAGATAPSGPAADDDPWGQAAEADGDDASVDPNLAARAADRSTVRFEDPPAIEADASAAGWDAAALAAHDAPPLAPAAEQHPTPENIESFAARRARRERLRNQPKSRVPRPGTIIVTLLAVFAALIGWRSDVVRVMPGTASLFAAIGLPVNLRGLAFSDITTTKESHDGATILVVQGTITNISKQPRDVPRIRLSMKNAKGAEVYTWTSLPERTTLAPGDSQPFQTRLASPPPEGLVVEVRFFNRRDIARGGR
jgi:predicted Zn finger-like uncharacterized protein